jgi:hypothetical protein
MIIKRILQMLQACETPEHHFPLTDLFNENWMLRIVLDWFATHGKHYSLVPVLAGSRWYSEALLASAFLATFRGDPNSESYTHADGVIGHFNIGGSGKGDLVVKPKAKQFTVIEAKMFSRLSTGVKNAGYYDQAARTVACMAEVLRLANRRPEDMSRLSFYVVAPQAQIDQGLFSRQISKESIQRKVERRVSAYEGKKDQWFQDWFMPLLAKMSVESLSWEAILQYISDKDRKFGIEAQKFYQNCLKHNQKGQ